jgi:predicted dehydrogenase
VVEEKVKPVAEQLKANAYTDFRKMCKKEDLNAVYICTPPFAHGKQEMAAIKAKAHIFVEKPIHLNVAKAQAIASKLQGANLIGAVGYQDRYQDIIDKLKAYLASHPAGMFMGYWMGGMPGVAWWRRKEQSGGQHVEQTTHIFDMARYLFGEVDYVWADGRVGMMTEVPEYNIEDASAVTLKFKSGLTGTVFSACFLGVGSRCGLDIWCKDAHVWYQERTLIRITEKGKPAPEETKVANPYAVEEDRTFIQAVATGDASKIRSTYADAVRSLAVSLAATKSISTKKVVKVG